MKLTITWADGSQRTLTDVVGFGREWVGEEYELGVQYRDGESDVFTGRDLAVIAGSEVNGRTYRVSESASNHES